MSTSTKALYIVDFFFFFNDEFETNVITEEINLMSNYTKRCQLFTLDVGL